MATKIRTQSNTRRLKASEKCQELVLPTKKNSNETFVTEQFKGISTTRSKRKKNNGWKRNGYLPGATEVVGAFDEQSGRSEGLERHDEMGEVELSLQVELHAHFLDAVLRLPPRPTPRSASNPKLVQVHKNNAKLEPLSWPGGSRWEPFKRRIGFEQLGKLSKTR